MPDIDTECACGFSAAKAADLKRMEDREDEIARLGGSDGGNNRRPSAQDRDRRLTLGLEKRRWQQCPEQEFHQELITAASPQEEQDGQEVQAVAPDAGSAGEDPAGAAAGTEPGGAGDGTGSDAELEPVVTDDPADAGRPTEAAEAAGDAGVPEAAAESAAGADEDSKDQRVTRVPVPDDVQGDLEARPPQPLLADSDRTDAERTTDRPAAADEDPDPEDQRVTELLKLNKDALVAEAEKAGVETEGTKADIAARLVDQEFPQS